MKRWPLHIAILILVVVAMRISECFATPKYHGVGALEVGQTLEVDGIVFINEGVQIPATCKIITTQVVEGYVVYPLDCGKREYRLTVEIETMMIYIERRVL